MQFMDPELVAMQRATDVTPPVAAGYAHHPTMQLSLRRTRLRRVFAGFAALVALLVCSHEWFRRFRPVDYWILGARIDPESVLGPGELTTFAKPGPIGPIDFESNAPPAASKIATWTLPDGYAMVTWDGDTQGGWMHWLFIMRKGADGVWRSIWKWSKNDC